MEITTFLYNLMQPTNQNMPWFSILGNYSTTLSVPKGIANTTIPFSDIAGVGRPTAWYTLQFGYWNNINHHWKNIQLGLIYKIILHTQPVHPLNLQTYLMQVQDQLLHQFKIYTIPPGNRLFDAFTVVNAFGGEDGCIVQVQDSTGTINYCFRLIY